MRVIKIAEGTGCFYNTNFCTQVLTLLTISIFIILLMFASMSYPKFVEQ